MAEITSVPNVKLFCGGCTKLLTVPDYFINPEWENAGRLTVSTLTCGHCGRVHSQGELMISKTVPLRAAAGGFTHHSSEVDVRIAGGMSGTLNVEGRGYRAGVAIITHAPEERDGLCPKCERPFHLPHEMENLTKDYHEGETRFRGSKSDVQWKCPNPLCGHRFVMDDDIVLVVSSRSHRHTITTGDIAGNNGPIAIGPGAYASINGEVAIAGVGGGMPPAARIVS